jgi:hypothetical protein
MTPKYNSVSPGTPECLKNATLSSDLPTPLTATPILIGSRASTACCTTASFRKHNPPRLAEFHESLQRRSLMASKFEKLVSWSLRPRHSDRRTSKPDTPGSQSPCALLIKVRPAHSPFASAAKPQCHSARSATPHNSGFFGFIRISFPSPIMRSCQSVKSVQPVSSLQPTQKSPDFPHFPPNPISFHSLFALPYSPICTAKAKDFIAVLFPKSPCLSCSSVTSRSSSCRLKKHRDRWILLLPGRKELEIVTNPAQIGL